MRNLRNYLGLSCVTLSCLALTFSGCKKEEEAGTTVGGTPVVGSKKPAAEVDPAVAAILAKADALDGAVDKTVSKCSACALAMDGSATHSLKFSGYKMHFCSSGCKDGFSSNTKDAVLAMSVPGD